jgi:hypothetical protein
VPPVYFHLVPQCLSGNNSKSLSAFPQFSKEKSLVAAIAIDTIFLSHDNPMKVRCLPDEFQPLHARAWAASGGD